MPIDSNVFRRRYTIVDHENKNTREVGLMWVLNPAKNPADLAAMIELAKNVPPEMAAKLQAHIDLINESPEGKARKLGSYGTECLPHITHPDVVEFARGRLSQTGKKLLIDEKPKTS
jgi:hypothetical protein